MKKLLAIAVGTFVLLVSGMPFAQDMKAPASKSNANAMQSGSPMNIGGQMGQMDEQMKKMQSLHEKMVNAVKPEERQKVMGEQRKEMQGGMAMMTPMMQGGAMMGGMGAGGMGQKGKPVNSDEQIKMMQKRMDMMQMMMQAMMDQQGMPADPKGLDASPGK